MRESSVAWDIIFSPVEEGIEYLSTSVEEEAKREREGGREGGSNLMRHSGDRFFFVLETPPRHCQGQLLGDISGK